MGLNVGSRVRHSFLGPGSVMEIQRGGRVARVCFDNKPQVGWLVVASELQPLTDEDGAGMIMSALAKGYAASRNGPQEDALPPALRGLPLLPPSKTSAGRPPKAGPASGGPASPRVPPELPSLLPEDDVGIHVPADITEAQALHAIEALRLGVVPRHLIESYTVGRSDEVRMVHDDLQATEAGGAFRVIMGDYGTGKTHHLEFVEALALSRNFLTCRITLDARENPPSMPKRVYREVVKALRYPDLPGHECGGLAPLLDRILLDRDATEELLRFNGKAYHTYLSPALAYYRDLREHDATRAVLDMLLDWIEGHPTVSNVLLDQRLKHDAKKYHRLFALMDFCPWSHIYAYLLGGLGVWARRAGYGGLVLLVDEAEFYSLLNSAHAYHAAVLFSYYAAAAVGPKRVRVDIDSLPRGGHLVHRAIPALYAEHQHLYVNFAITPDSSGVKVLGELVDPSLLVELSPLVSTDYVDLCSRVWGLYHRAYPEYEPPTASVGRLGALLHQGVEYGRLGNVRQALKLLVEIVDLARHEPASSAGILAKCESALGGPSFS